MRIIFLLTMALIIGYLAFQKLSPLLLDQLAEIGSTKISRNLAVENVKKLSEVQQYLKDVPNGKVEVDNELEGEYNVHVYEVKNGHTATFNWYSVSIKSGEVRSEFSVEQTPEETTGSSKITAEQARMVVNSLPEVLEYFKNVPNGKIEVDNETEDEYNVHVYEVKNGHTATFNWYRVNAQTGEISPQFETKGTVTGKLCYPSEVVPEGIIEAKRLADGKVFILNHGGSSDEAGLNFKFKLEEGNYFLRYNVQGKIFGYSTTVCPTGKEETCGDTKLRIARKAEVKTGQELKNYDLCDYYYKDSNAPKF